LAPLGARPILEFFEEEAPTSVHDADRIEPFDLEVARAWAEVSIRFPSLRDGDRVIAATALAKGDAVATRNVGDPRRVGVPLVSPFDRGAWDADGDEDPVATLMQG
jgi:predicted nucleic acid-binding protein